ncbi:calcium-binding protein [Streptomyces sp. NPDC051940]|uniref:calcium-binding protein n=1 Tax=Streptomyces sp. NPDC051940 TaxID=3155675 RepID=UPI003423B9EF
MRKSVIGAAVAVTLGLGAAAVPAAQASEGQGLQAKSVTSVKHAGGADSGAKASTLGWTQGNTTFSSVVVNSNKNIAVGTSSAKTFTIVMTITDPDGIDWAYGQIWRAADASNPSPSNTAQVFPDPDTAPDATCVAVTSTTSKCTQTITILPHDSQYYYLRNSMAGTWYTSVMMGDKLGNTVQNHFYKTVKVQRYAKVTVNASPEPVYKGKTLTVTGKLTRASWDSFTYLGYGGQWVSLDYRKSGGSYAKVKGVQSSSTGYLKGYATAYADGYWRYYYKGNTPTSAAAAGGDYVDVR